MLCFTSLLSKWPLFPDDDDERTIEITRFLVLFLFHYYIFFFYFIANVNSHLVSENDRLKDAVRDVNNRLHRIQVSLNGHRMKHDAHQANFTTLQNEQRNQSAELARLIRDTADAQERIRRLESHVNAQGTMLGNISDSVRDLAATLTRRVDIENL